MTTNQARILADHFIEEAQKLGARRSPIDSPREQFYADGAAITILLALAGAFNKISTPESLDA